jgi:hypothetical protein
MKFQINLIGRKLVGRDPKKIIKKCVDECEGRRRATCWLRNIFKK